MAYFRNFTVSCWDRYAKSAAKCVVFWFCVLVCCCCFYKSTSCSLMFNLRTRCHTNHHLISFVKFMRDLSMWLKLRNQKCSPAFQASLLVKLRINWRSRKNGLWSITNHCVYPWPFPYRGTRDGAVVRALASHQCGPDSNPRVDVICGVEFVVGSLPCSERFFSG